MSLRRYVRKTKTEIVFKMQRAIGAKLELYWVHCLCRIGTGPREGGSSIDHTRVSNHVKTFCFMEGYLRWLENK